MRKSSQLILIAGVLLVGSLSRVVFAQADGRQRNPTMASQIEDASKDQLFAQFTEYKKSLNPEDRRLAYPVARSYLLRFGGEDDSNAKEVRKFVTDYERAVNRETVFAAYNAKNYAKAFELARPHLKVDADDFFALAILSEAGYENAGNATLNEETIGYTRRAIKLLEGGKLTKADPFINMEIAKGFLNSTLGYFVKDQAPAEAAAAFLKAVQSDSIYRNDPAIYHRMGVAIIKGEFTPLSAEYNEKYGAKQASAEQQAMLKQLLHTADRAIDAYARAVALSAKPEQAEARTKILAQLTALYKNFHNNSDAGLDELIATVLSKPLP
jgi:hypothetical protein